MAHPLVAFLCEEVFCNLTCTRLYSVQLWTGCSYRKFQVLCELESTGPRRLRTCPLNMTACLTRFFWKSVAILSSASLVLSIRWQLYSPAEQSRGFLGYFRLSEVAPDGQRVHRDRQSRCRFFAFLGCQMVAQHLCFQGVNGDRNDVISKCLSPYSRQSGPRNARANFLHFSTAPSQEASCTERTFRCVKASQSHPKTHR